MFQDVDIALAAKHCIVSCEELVETEVMHRSSELNSIPCGAVDAIVHVPFGAHPSQCFNYYDYDGMLFKEYDKVSEDDTLFEQFLEKYVFECHSHWDYLDKFGSERLMGLRVQLGKGYVCGLKRR